MDAKTLEALKGSIAKWEAIVAGASGSQGSDNCPLCAEFYKNDCAGCPVADQAGEIHCRRTPHYEWTNVDRVLENGWGGYDFDNSPADALRLAQAELDFLRSLLPAEETAA